MRHGRGPTRYGSAPMTMPRDVGALRRALQRSALFQALPRSDLDALAALAQPRHYAAGAPICIEGDLDGALYVIVSGRVRISAGSVDGGERHLNELGAADLIGEIALLDGGRRSATATAVENTETYRIDRATFSAFVERTPALARGLIELLCQRVRWMTNLLEASAFLGTAARLARWLVILATQHGVANARGVEVRVSQHELAQFLGTSRQSVNEILRAWHNEGLIEVRRGRVVVLDSQALEHEAAKPLAAASTDEETQVVSRGAGTPL